MFVWLSVMVSAVELITPVELLKQQGLSLTCVN